MVLRNPFFEYLRETLCKHALEHLEAARLEEKLFFFLPTVNARLLLTSVKACDWSGHVFGASASPSSLTKKTAMSPASTVHGGRHATKYVCGIRVANNACGIRASQLFGVISYLACLNQLVQV